MHHKFLLAVGQDFIVKFWSGFLSVGLIRLYYKDKITLRINSS